MKLLLNDEYAPLTSSIGFIEAPLDRVADALVTWRKQLLYTFYDPDAPGPPRPTTRLDLRLAGTLRQWLQGRRIERKVVNGAFPEILRRLEPLTATGQARELLLATDSSWTAYLDNGYWLQERFTPTTYLAQLLGCRALLVTCVPETLDTKREQPGRYGAVQFELFSPAAPPPLHGLRTIALTNDGGRWRFDAFGEVQPFELVERYGARRKRDRFDPEMLGAYCEAVGVRYFDPTYYGPKGVLICHHPTPAGLTLEQAQRTQGIQPSTP